MAHQLDLPLTASTHWPTPRRTIAVVGAGWAGLSAAIALTESGHHVTLVDMAPTPGGRARSLGPLQHDDPGFGLDNGQHILIGAYRETLSLMRKLGVRPEDAFIRCPLTLRYADGRGLSLDTGPAVWCFFKAVLRCGHWTWTSRWRLLQTATLWRLQGFRCSPTWTVERLCRALPREIRQDFINPLCIAALNTPAHQASAAVFLRVLQDALFSGPGASDLLLPRWDLSALLPGPAIAWLQQHQQVVHLRTRITQLQPASQGWNLLSADGKTLEVHAVILACSCAEAARLTARLDARWSQCASRLPQEPIVTAVLQRLPYTSSHALGLGAPIVALEDGDQAPAQFLFDLGALRTDTPAAQGHYAAVVSGAGPWVSRGLLATTEAIQAQTQPWLGPTKVVHVCCEKRATLLCTPDLRRPPMAIGLPQLWVAGDYVEGPYPSTLEGAVRSGLAAAAAANMA